MGLTLLLVVVISSSVEAANLRQLPRNLQTSTDILSAMLARVNQERATANLPPLCGNTKLQSSAQRHANDMSANDFMAHDGSDGSTLSQRITQAGFHWSAVGENVAAGQEDVDAVMDAWMLSPEHRANIMGDFTMLGAANAFKESTTYEHYWTQDFGKGDTESCDSIPSTNSDNQNPVEQGNETPVPKTDVYVTETPEHAAPFLQEKVSFQATFNSRVGTPHLSGESMERSAIDSEIPEDCSPHF